MNHTLSVSADGSIETLWTEKLPLHEFGTLTMKRASTIEFNEAIQMWEVFLSGSRVASYANKSREECLRWEDEYFNQQLLKS